MSRRKPFSLTKIRVAKMEPQVSAGGVLFRRAGGVIEVALIGLKGGSVWALPKGRVEKGEDLEATATREIKEETGLVGRLLQRLGEIEYWFYDRQAGVCIQKTVRFYLFEGIGGRSKFSRHQALREEVSNEGVSGKLWPLGPHRPGLAPRRPAPARHAISQP